MSAEFQRETRYVVLKLKDVEHYVTPEGQRDLDLICAAVNAGRAMEERGRLGCVVVERDWPEFEPTWAAIESRMTGKQAAVSDQPLGFALFRNGMQVGIELTLRQAQRWADAEIVPLYRSAAKGGAQ